MAETTSVSKLVVNYLTEEQYATAKASGLINPNELYFTEVQDSITLNTYEELFTATAGQTLFTLTEGTYQINKSRLTVCVNGAQQPSTAYTETSSSSFTFASGLSVGDSVIARYINAKIVSEVDVMTHTHGNITNEGHINATPNLPVFTGINGIVETKTIESAKSLFGIAPTGSIVIWGGSTTNIPSGWLLCNGASLDPLIYPNLFNAIGTTFGGNGFTSFIVPNLTDRFVVGAGTTYTVGAKGGESTHVLTVDEMPAHSHVSKAGPEGGDQSSPVTAYLAVHSAAYASPGDATSFTLPTETTGGGLAHENKPPYFALAYIIKT